MISSKLLYHDFRCGLCRWRYLFVPLLIILPLLDFYIINASKHLEGTWMDIFCYLFKGIQTIPFHSTFLEKIDFPTNWIFIFGCSMMVNLDYIMQDLTRSGQQVIIRCRNRSKWFLSKCIWCIASSFCFFALVLLVVTVFALFTDAELTISISPDIWRLLLGVGEVDRLTNSQVIVSGIILPLFTLVSINLLEMVLCLLVKPIFSFLFCLSLLILNIWFDSKLMLGCTGMVIRNIIECNQENVTFTRVLVTALYS